MQALTEFCDSRVRHWLHPHPDPTQPVGRSSKVSFTNFRFLSCAFSIRFLLLGWLCSSWVPVLVQGPPAGRTCVPAQPAQGSNWKGMWPAPPCEWAGPGPSSVSGHMLSNRWMRRLGSWLGSDLDLVVCSGRWRASQGHRKTWSWRADLPSQNQDSSAGTRPCEMHEQPAPSSVKQMNLEDRLPLGGVALGRVLNEW